MILIRNRVFIFLTFLCVFKFSLGSGIRNPATESDRFQRNAASFLKDMDANERCSEGDQLEVRKPVLVPCVNSVKKEHIDKFFDARVKWPYCPSIFEVANQGNCSSGWAVAVASSLTDRYCIANHGKDHFDFSAYDLLSCGADAAAWKNFRGTKIRGCAGGSVQLALKYLLRNGTVSGTSYTPGTYKGYGCRPYELVPSLRGYERGIPTPKCSGQCQETYKPSYEKDIIKLNEACSVNPTVEEIQTEIMNHGPVVAVMKVWQSFQDYNTREVYEVLPEKDQLISNQCQAVKIIGWGTQLLNGRGVDYWLVANSWGSNWGVDGFFKIIRGQNTKASNAWIETQVSAGRFNFKL